MEVACITVIVAIAAAVLTSAAHYWLLGAIVKKKRSVRILCPYHALILAKGQVALLDAKRCEVCLDPPSTAA